MKKVAILLLLMACFNCEAADPCVPIEKKYKSVELYSWNADGEWVFAVLPVTSRNKTAEVIRSYSECIRTLEGVQRIISALGEDGFVAWIEDLSSGFEIAPDDVMALLTASASSAGVRVDIIPDCRAEDRDEPERNPGCSTPDVWP